MYTSRQVFRNLPGGYTAEIVWAKEGEELVYQLGHRGEKLLRWAVRVFLPEDEAEKCRPLREARFTQLWQAERWLEWQIADLHVLFPGS